MPTPNKLAPAPVNALAAPQLPAEWGKFLAPGSAAYEAAVLLNATGQLPKIGFAKLSEAGRSGEYDKESNSITLNTDSKNLAMTLPHELTHVKELLAV